MTILPFGDEEAQVAAALRKELESQGQSIGMADYLIATVCIANQGTLLTRNRKHFQRVKDLELSGSVSREK
jgi:tRNA(fMet)-specific endonuclease VapC